MEKLSIDWRLVLESSLIDQTGLDELNYTLKLAERDEEYEICKEIQKLIVSKKREIKLNSLLD